MAYKIYRRIHRSFLKRKNLLHRVKTRRSIRILELAEITDRMCKSIRRLARPCLLRSKGLGLSVGDPILFGSFERMAMALEVNHLDDVGKRIESLLMQAPPKTLMEKIAMLPKLMEDFPGAASPCHQRRRVRKS